VIGTSKTTFETGPTEPEGGAATRLTQLSSGVMLGEGVGV
jgi:hypothetical protein